MPLAHRSLARPLLRLLGALVGLLLLSAAALWATTELPSPAHLRDRAALGDTRILDRSGRLIAALPDPLGDSRRPVALDQIPLTLQRATIAVEDASFYTNSGIEPRGILRALWQNASSGEIVAGGSTITQQLARNFLLDPQLGRQQSLERKLREIILALKLSSSYSKDEILTLYLNQTYYGNLSYGVEAAAWRLFGKPVRDLDLAESALIAGLPQAPSRLDPLADGGAAARARQRQVLDAMVRTGSITSDQADQAAAEPLTFSSGACRPGSCSSAAPHVVDYVIGQLGAQLGPDLLTRGGLTITTTIDLGLQEVSQAMLARQIALLEQPHDGSPDRQARNGAVVVIDPADGAILTMVGSPDFSDRASQGQVNAATALRQPGSALKPLTYAAALERGWTPATMLLDVPTSFSSREGRPYTPQNYDRRFHGPLSMREALATSSNVAAVRTLQAIGIAPLLDMAERLGIRSLGRDPGRFGLALTLGGGEVTLLELTGAYAGFANGGSRVEPYMVLQVVDSAGGLLHDARPEPAPAMDRAVSPQVAFLISDILSDPYARMRAFGAQLEIGRPAAVKTGTTTDWRDNWTVGYTPDRVVGVWIGNADGQPMEAVSGVTGAGPVWRGVMRAANHGLPARPFLRPDGIIELEICADSGMLPGPHCPATRRELFLAGSQPTLPDDTHVALRVDLSGSCRAPADYPPQLVATRVFQRLPPEAEPWAVDAGVPLIPRRLCAPVSVDEPAADGPLVAGPAVGASGPAVVSPPAGAVFAISPGVPPERQQIEITARGGAATERLVLLLDGQPLASFRNPPYRAFWQLAPGRHTLQVEEHAAGGGIVRSAPVEFVVEP